MSKNRRKPRAKANGGEGRPDPQTRKSKDSSQRQPDSNSPGNRALKSAAKAAGQGLFDEAWEWLTTEAEAIFGELPEIAEIAIELLPELLMLLL